MTYRLILDECREKFGPAPRKLSEADLAEFRLEVPFSRKLAFWMGHPLKKLPSDIDGLAAAGTLTWGYVVGAEEKLRSAKNRLPHTAIVLYGLDASWDDRAEELERIGEALAGDAAFAQSELATARPPLGKPLPTERADGESGLALGGTLLSPTMLPQGTLERKLLPVLILPAKTQQIVALPKKWWSDALLAYWTESPETAA